MSGAVAQLGAFVSGFSYFEMPTAVTDAAALHALDVLGCGLAADALGEVPWVKDSLDSPHGRSTAIGLRGGLGAADAALVNGTLCHALDFDDTHPAAIVHASAVVAPAAIAVGEALGRSGPELLAALVVGNEVAVRLGLTAGRGFHARGLHSTSICGVFGAAAAAARLRQLDATRTAHALGLAASMASGTLEFLADGAQTKPLHAGWAAHAGVVAARLAASGAEAPATALEGERGLFATYLRGAECDVHAHIADVGHRWETPNLAFKLYPVCHYIHAALEALGRLQREHALSPDDVASIVVLADELTVSLVLDPLDAKRVPRTPYDAKFSLPYCLAAQLVTGTVEVQSFTPAAIADPRVLGIAARVSYEPLGATGATNAFAGGVRVERVDGTVIEAHASAPGHADNPISTDDVLAKYRRNAGLALRAPAVVKLEAGIRSMQFGGDLSAIACLADSAARTTTAAPWRLASVPPA